MKNTTLSKILSTASSTGMLTIVVIVSAVGGYTIWQAAGLAVSIAGVMGLTLLDGMISGVALALAGTDKKLGDLID